MSDPGTYTITYIPSPVEALRREGGSARTNTTLLAHFFHPHALCPRAVCVCVCVCVCSNVSVWAQAAANYDLLALEVLDSSKFLYTQVSPLSSFVQFCELAHRVRTTTAQAPFADLSTAVLPALP